jgi:hypothetical protein
LKNKTEGRRVTIEEARRAPRCMIHWRPESNLPENQQYAVILWQEKK